MCMRRIYQEFPAGFNPGWNHRVGKLVQAKSVFEQSRSHLLDFHCWSLDFTVFQPASKLIQLKWSETILELLGKLCNVDRIVEEEWDYNILLAPCYK